MSASYEIFGASIVVLGAFNPPLLSLDWFNKNALVGDGDAGAARGRNDYVVTRQISRFQTDLAVFQVIDSQLSVSAVGPVTPALSDLVLGIFELLPDTPVSAMGLNFNSHYKIGDAQTFHKIGDTLAPKKIWNTIFPDHAAGVAELTIRVQQGSREKNESTLNERRVTMQPSGKIKPYGVFLQVNHHFGAALDDKPLKDASAAAQIVKQHWQPCFAGAQELFETIIAMASSEKNG
jgi:hypothetical protein